jgi:hypothetical protein
MTNYTRSTTLRFKGRLDRGYFVLRVMPDDFFRPLVVELPPGVEVSIGGQWKADPHPISLRPMATCSPAQTFELHLRNLSGHPIDADLSVKGISPKTVGRRKIVGWLNYYQEADTA